MSPYDFDIPAFNSLPVSYWQPVRRPYLARYGYDPTTGKLGYAMGILNLDERRCSQISSIGQKQVKVHQYPILTNETRNALAPMEYNLLEALHA